MIDTNSQPTQPQAQTSARSNRGFASMDASKQREIARKGGQAAHRSGRAHEFDSREASEAGRKGGMVVSRDRAHMARIGAAGGRARGLAHQRALQAQQQGGSQAQSQSQQIPAADKLN
jgi:uncharacterized protein